MRLISHITWSTFYAKTFCCILYIYIHTQGIITLICPLAMGWILPLLFFNLGIKSPMKVDLWLNKETKPGMKNFEIPHEIGIWPRFYLPSISRLWGSALKFILQSAMCTFPPNNQDKPEWKLSSIKMVTHVYSEIQILFLFFLIECLILPRSNNIKKKFQSCIDEWNIHWNKCIECQRDYSEEY